MRIKMSTFIPVVSAGGISKGIPTKSKHDSVNNFVFNIFIISMLFFQTEVSFVIIDFLSK